MEKRLIYLICFKDILIRDGQTVDFVDQSVLKLLTRQTIPTSYVIINTQNPDKERTNKQIGIT